MRCWVEVDLDAVAHNLAAVRRLVGEGPAILAVVKADGYGHGAVAVAREALAAGARRLGVFDAEEAAPLRAAGIAAPILAFRPPADAAEAARLVDLDLTATVASPEAAAWLERAAAARGRRVKVHVEVDAGLHRFGVSPREAPDLLRSLAGSPLLEVEGVYCHLPFRGARARARFRDFASLLDKLSAEGLRPPLAHAAATGTLAGVPGAHLDMVRVGNALYGVAPASHGLALRKTWRLRAAVAAVRTVRRGETVGYAGDFTARREMRVAVLPVGFADGFMADVVRPVRGWGDLLYRPALEGWRSLRTLLRGDGVTFDGRPLRLVGRVGMQHCCVDATALPGVEPGEAVDLTARFVLASPRLPRVYLKDGRPAAAGETAADAGPQGGL